jgi:hypothetical protein
MAFFQNNNASPFLVSQGVITARRPGALNATGPFDDWVPAVAAQTVQPGATLPVGATWIVPADAPVGQWRVYLAIKDATLSTWYDGAPSILNVSATPVVLPPAAPANLTIQAISVSRIDSAWQLSAPVTVKLERSRDGVSFSEIASIPPGNAFYTDNGLRRNTLYFYRVRSWNGILYSDYSPVSSARTFKH